MRELPMLMTGEMVVQSVAAKRPGTLTPEENIARMRAMWHRINESEAA